MTDGTTTPCPSCGNESLHVERVAISGQLFYRVICDRCSAIAEERNVGDMWKARKDGKW